MQSYELKAKDLTGDTLKILGIPFFGPFNGKDLDNEWFSPRTDLKLKFYDRVPFLYEHTHDATIGGDPIGTVDLTSAEKTDEGWWFKVQLDRAHAYHAEIKRLLEKQVLYVSSQAFPSLVRKARSGEILVWPIIEISGTVTPCNVLAVAQFDTDSLATVGKHYKSVGLEFEPLHERLEADLIASLPDSDFAAILADGTRALALPDAEHVRVAAKAFDPAVFDTPEATKKAARRIVNRAKKFGVDLPDDLAVTQSSGRARRLMYKAMERPYESLIETLNDAVNGGMFGQSVPWLPKTGYATVLETYPDRCIVRYTPYDADGPTDDLESGYYQVDFTVDDEGTPRLGDVTPVIQSYTPLKAEGDAHLAVVPLSLVCEHAIKSTQAALSRTKDVMSRRVEEGRKLSDAHRARVKALSTVMGQTAADLSSFLTSMEPPATADVDLLHVLELRTRDHLTRLRSSP